MSHTVLVIGVSSRVVPAAEVHLEADPEGYAHICGERVLSLSHLPGHLAVVETASTLLIVPWPMLNRLLKQARIPTSGSLP